MDLRYNRTVACAVLAVCAVGSIFGFGGNALSSEKKQAVAVFENGTEPNYSVRYSMDAYLDNCAGYTTLMAEEYRLKAGKDSDNARKAEELAAQITDGDINSRYQAYGALKTAIESLYTDFYSLGLSEDDTKVFHAAYTDFQGEVDKIGYDDYHRMADAYNNLENGFPASLVSGVLGLGKLESFR